MSELAAAIVHRLERIDSPSRAVMRRGIYDVLGGFGINVRDLVMEERRLRGEELRMKALKSQRRVEKLQDWAGKIDALQFAVFGEHPSQERTALVLRIRELLKDKEKKVADIVIATDVERAFVIAIRDLDYARGCAAELTAKRKQLPRKHKRAYQLFLERTRNAWTPEPTKERVRQEGFGDENKPVPHATTGGGRRHQFTWTVDQVRHLLTDAEYMAAERYRDAFVGMEPSSAVGNLSGSGGGGNPSSKLALTPHQEHCAREFNWLHRKLPTLFRMVLTNAALNRASPGGERPLARVELGRKLYGNPDLGEHQARGAADGLIKAALSLLAFLSHQLNGEIKQERLQIAKFIETQPGIRSHIRAAGNPAATPDMQTASQQVAIGLVCKRTKYSRWLIRKVVIRAVEMARQDRDIAEAAHSRQRLSCARCSSTIIGAGVKADAEIFCSDGCAKVATADRVVEAVA